MAVPGFTELLIGTAELSDTVDVLIIVISFAGEPDYASSPQVLCLDALPWVLTS
jgi:hypothetical protein